MHRRFVSSLIAAGALAIGVFQTAPSAQAAPRGMRLVVRSYFYVTNSDDGFHDNTVEAYGAVFFKGQRVWYVDRERAINAVDDATDRDPRKKISFSTRTYDVLFNDPATWKLRVAGYLHDRDRGSKDDLMWRINPLPREIDMKRAYEQQSARPGNFDFIAGDHDSESADLRFVFTKSSDIY